MITLSEAKHLQFREVLVDSSGKRWYVNGKVQTWKRNPLRIRVPLKHGLYAYDAMTEAGFHWDEKLGQYVNPNVTRESNA